MTNAVAYTFEDGKVLKIALIDDQYILNLCDTFGNGDSLHISHRL
jgi:hypothetical protein